MKVTVIGAGLAGSECAWQLAQRGIQVRLCEMKPEKMTPEERLVHLRRVLIESFDLTIAGLLQDRTPISPATVDARNALLAEKAAEGTGQDRK